MDDTRLLRDTLGQLVTGTLVGLFEAPTTFTVNWTAPIQSMSLSALDGLGDPGCWFESNRGSETPGQATFRLLIEPVFAPWAVRFSHGVIT
jgi:hypothetical protein